MGKIFLTARKIDEYANCGVFEIQIDNNIVVTDIGQERARDRGVRLVRVQSASMLVDPQPCRAEKQDQLKDQVRTAVIARLGGTPENLDAIITKVLTGLK